MENLSYSIFVNLTYHLAAYFAVGLPCVLMIWSYAQKEASMIRLMSIYWKVSSLLAISMLLLTNQRPIGYLITFLAPILMVLSVWFWVDLNEELADLPPWRALPLTVRIWRWALSGFGLVATLVSAMSLSCMNSTSLPRCMAWVDGPQGLHQLLAKVFAFLFGGSWTEPVAAFIGYLALIAYTVGLLQWLLVRLPKQGRIAGEF